MSGNSKNKWLGIVTRFLTLTVPIILCGYVLIEKYIKLDYFIKIEFNGYRINNVLIMFIFLTFITILINICFYIFESYKLVFQYKGLKKSILWINCLSFIFIVITAGFIILFIGTIFLNGINLLQIIDYNRILTLAIFILFFVIDSALIISNKIEIGEIKTHIDELKKSTDKNNTIEELQLKIIQSKYNIQLSIDSTFLINIPTIAIIVLSNLLAKRLIQIDYYKYFVDNNFLHPLIMTLPDDKLLRLFTDGIDTGIIMTSVLFSQIIFFVIKTKWQYHSYSLKN